MYSNVDQVSPRARSYNKIKFQNQIAFLWPFVSPSLPIILPLFCSESSSGLLKAIMTCLTRFMKAPSLLLLLLLPISFFLFSTNLPTSNAAPLVHINVRKFQPSDEVGGASPWEETRRLIAEIGDNSTSLILAESRTNRKDPTDDFKRYPGGWNISNTHYWASVGFTAVPFLATAAAWFVIFGLTLSCICLCFCCCRKAPYGYSRTCYALSLIFLILFTVAAIVGCAILYTGQGKFHSSTTNTLDYVVDQADTVVDKLHKLSDYLATAKSLGIGPVTLNEDIQSKINDVQVKINSTANLLAEKTQENAEHINKGLDTVRIALIVVAAIMLLLAFIGFLLSICGYQCLVYTLVILGWLLVTGTFILCGAFLVVHNVVGDTCVAMDEWVENPTAHTALDDILPCVDKATSQSILAVSQEVTLQIVSTVNTVIANVTNIDPPDSIPLYYNQTGPLVPALCNPYNSDLTNRTCIPGEVDVGTAKKVWKGYVCQVSSSSICTTTGRLTPMFYTQMSSAVNVSYGLYHYVPFLADLVDCEFVRSAFSDISKVHCPGLRVFSRWIYIGLVVVSAAVMLSLIFWVIYARERSHRVHTKRVDKEGGGYSHS